MNYVSLVNFIQAVQEMCSKPVTLTLSGAVAVYSRTNLSPDSDLDILIDPNDDFWKEHQDVKITTSECGRFSSRRVQLKISGVLVELFSDFTIHTKDGEVSLNGDDDQIFYWLPPCFREHIRLTRREVLVNLYTSMGRDKDKAIYHKLMDSPLHAALADMARGKTLAELKSTYNIDVMALCALL